jgi:hypothetical protein
VNETRALSIITRRLQPGETLVWHSTPTPLLAARDYFGPLLFLTVIATSIARSPLDALFAIKVSDWHFPNPDVLPVLLCICLFGLWVWTGKKAADCWRTAYALTDRRIIIAAGMAGPESSYDATALVDMKRTGDELKGSILFNYGWLPLWRHQWRGYRNGLYGIRTPARVEALIYETLLPGRKGAAI